MDELIVQRSAPLFLSRTADLPRAGLRRVGQAVVLGFDTEWDPQAQGSPLLSFQLAAEIDGKVVGAVLDAPAPRLEPVHVVGSVREFINRHGIDVPQCKGRRHFCLVAHFAQAELSMFSDAQRDFRIRQIGKAHFAALAKAVVIDGERWTFSIVDLWAFYPGALKKIGDAIGLPKIEVDDRGDLARVKREDRAKFDAYALRDAEIAVVSFTRLRELMLAEYEADPLILRTLASLASAIFRHHFFSTPPAPVARVSEPTWRKSKAGAWRQGTKTVSVYAGDPAGRVAALRAYWGGRVEAYGRGLLETSVEERDIISLYPHAALAQPLPNANTRWERIVNVPQVADREGFGRFQFKFPRETRYPCLPVNTKGRLVFPLSGVTDCTFSEVRLALRLGADVGVVEAFGFEAGAAERDHDLARYMRAFITRKSSATKGTLAYDTWKLLLNALVGKLAEQVERNLLLHLEHQARQHGFRGVGSVVASSGALRGAIHMDAGVGGLWAPEWATLILGKARALIGGIVACSEPYLVSTDAVIVRANQVIVCPELDLLQELGSGLTVEKHGDALFLGRSRQYAILTRPENLPPDKRGLAQNATWAVVKAARHGSVESEPEFAATVLACIDAGADVAPTRSRIRLLGAEAAAREGLPINAEVPRIGRTHFTWDYKRRLLDRDANPFTMWTGTAPYTSMARLSAADVARDLSRANRRRALQRRAPWLLQKAVRLLRGGKGVRETARATGIPKSTVSDLHQRLLAGEHRGPRVAEGQSP